MVVLWNPFLEKHREAASRKCWRRSCLCALENLTMEPF
jgi:hypothetical protein